MTNTEHSPKFNSVSSQLENWYPRLTRVLFTDGAKYVDDRAAPTGFWTSYAIAQQHDKSCQPKIPGLELEVHSDRSATVFCMMETQPVYTQEIRHGLSG